MIEVTNQSMQAEATNTASQTQATSHSGDYRQAQRILKSSSVYDMVIFCAM